MKYLSRGVARNLARECILIEDEKKCSARIWLPPVRGQGGTPTRFLKNILIHIDYCAVQKMKEIDFHSDILLRKLVKV